MTTTGWVFDGQQGPLRGQLIRALLEHRDRLLVADPWLAFPQEACSSVSVPTVDRCPSAPCFCSGALARRWSAPALTAETTAMGMPLAVA